jgi:hypothetical protein
MRKAPLNPRTRESTDPADEILGDQDELETNGETVLKTPMKSVKSHRELNGSLWKSKSANKVYEKKKDRSTHCKRRPYIDGVMGRVRREWTRHRSPCASRYSVEEEKRSSEGFAEQKITNTRRRSSGRAVFFPESL